jgi:hypothetical protein
MTSDLRVVSNFSCSPVCCIKLGLCLIHFEHAVMKYFKVLSYFVQMLGSFSMDILYKCPRNGTVFCSHIEKYASLCSSNCHSTAVFSLDIIHCLH